MKLFYKLTIIFSLLFYSELVLSQEKVFNERLKSKEVIDKSSMAEVKEENVNLQSFVESIYVNSSKFYHQALPSIKKGEFLVLIIYSDSSKNRLIKTKHLEDVAVNRIEEFTFKKSPIYAAVYGSFAGTFGIVTLKIKE